MKKEHREIATLILGAIIVIGFFTLLIILVNRQIPEENFAILNIVVGALIGSFSTVVGYYYGSSIGSKDKTELISKT